MRILHLADLHANEGHFRWLTDDVRHSTYDALVVAGDLLDLFRISKLHAQLATIEACFAAIPPALPVFVCSGNHDRWSVDPELKDAAWMNRLRRGSVYLDGDTATLSGESFECVPWGGAPATTPDWIVCHAPPAGAFTATPHRVSESDTWIAPAFGQMPFINTDGGDPDLNDHLRYAGKGTVLCGHIHNPRSWHDSRPYFRSLNPAQDTQAEEPSRILIDTKTGTATRFRPGGAPLTIKWPRSVES